MKKILFLSTILFFFATTSLASDPLIPPRYATLWKNGIAQNLTCGTHNASANSVFVSGNDVYVVGFDTRGFADSSPRTAMLWKNGVAQELVSETNCTVAYSVFVLGKNVFVVGSGRFDIGYWGNNTHWRRYGNRIAIVWKNGVEQKLTDGNRSARAHSVFAYNDNVYVLIQKYNGIGSVVLWKNGVKQKIATESHSVTAYSLFVSNNDVYIVGRRSEDGSTLWKNGIAETFSDRFSGQSIFVSNNDIYVVGYGYPNGTALWRNGKLQHFDNDNAHQSRVSAIFVSDGNVYIAGQRRYGSNWRDFDFRPTLWKNGVAQTLASDESRWGECNSANSVFVSDDGDVYVVGHTKSSRW